MLKDLDLSVSLDKEQYKERLDELTIQIGQLQRQAREAGLPILVAFEGWEASGKGTQINRLLQTLDPRGYSVHVANPSEEDKWYPYWKRFWVRAPAKGRITVFDRGWCLEAIDCLYREKPDEKGFERACREINAFERQLADDGTLVLKFFLHIGRKEQKKRFDALGENENTAWKVSREDRRQNDQYKQWRDAVQAMVERTDTESARWHLVPSEDRRYATIAVLSQFAEAVSRALQDRAAAAARAASTKKAGQGDAPKDMAPDKGAARTPASELTRNAILSQVDLSLSLTKDDYAESLSHWQDRVRDMEHAMYRERVPLMVLYEGWDAAGKGGNIRRLTSPMDPRGYDVYPIAAPNEVERAHHYLWRFWHTVPKAGHLSILDRTWYGRVLVERVEGFCTPEEWRRAYREINELEEELTVSGVSLVKFWLHIDREEQLKRFEERQAVPWKQWKITEEDWRNREKWDQYEAAVDEMLFRTSTSYAPWTVVEANDKRYARIKALRTVAERMAERIDF
jgi:polyphosphate kinase 2 (PPK2 family)